MLMIWPLLARDSTKIEPEIKMTQKMRNLLRKSKKNGPTTRKTFTSSTKIREDSINLPEKY